MFIIPADPATLCYFAILLDSSIYNRFACELNKLYSCDSRIINSVPIPIKKIATFARQLQINCIKWYSCTRTPLVRLNKCF